jgi:hypothetical protein
MGYYFLGNASKIFAMFQKMQEIVIKGTVSIWNREVLSLNFGRDTGCPEVFRYFSKSL